jgi:hypothetical protein
MLSVVLEIEQERAKERNEEAGSIGGSSNSDEGSGNVSKPLEGTGSAREKAAEKINADVSGQRPVRKIQIWRNRTTVRKALFFIYQPIRTKASSRSSKKDHIK